MFRGLHLLSPPFLTLCSVIAMLLLRGGSSLLRRQALSSARVNSNNIYANPRNSEQNSRQVLIRDVDGFDRKVNILDIGESVGGGIPLVILAGTAQTTETFTGHFRALTCGRRLVIPELRNQGKTELLSEYGTMEQHVEDVTAILRALGVCRVDLCGFSFGGRVALAVASAHPQYVRKLSITGVPLHRAPLGSLILESWKDGLNMRQMRSVAWSFILNGYSEAFITRFSDRLPSFVDLICEANDPKKLADLMNLSHTMTDSHPFSVASCAARLTVPTQVIGASYDKISAIGTVKLLSEAIRGEFEEIPEAGHLVPFEKPTQWRNAILRFFDA